MNTMLFASLLLPFALGKGFGRLARSDDAPVPIPPVPGTVTVPTPDNPEAIPGFSLKANTTCECYDVWTDTDANAACVDIDGCPLDACDGDENGSWCLVLDTPTGCATEEGDNEGWAYCTPKTPDNPEGIPGFSLKANTPCQCYDMWTDTKSDPSCVDKRGCPTKACDGDAGGPWCLVLDT